MSRENVEASMSRNPMGLHGLLRGQRFSFFIIIIIIIIIIVVIII
jgi:t-SNARE complex subunit (syntaxin)